LIDATEQQRVIDAGVRALWRTVLERRKAELVPEEFAERFFRIARSTGHVDLFDDVAVLPRQVCVQVAGYPILDQDHGFLEQLTRHIDRAEVERGDILVAEIDLLEQDDLPRWMYARARGLVIVETASLGEFHWLHGHVRNLSSEEFSVTPRRAGHSVEFDGRWVCSTVTFCDSVVITHGEDSVEVPDDPVYIGDVVLYPAQAAGGEGVPQISRYEDEDDRFIADDCNADIDALADFVWRMRSADPVGTLRSLMEALSLERYPLLSGKTFRIAVGHDASAHSVELVD
jgi:hypothetical protein